MVSDLHTVSDRMLNALLYPLAGWGLAVAGLFLADHVAWALQLLYPLALWQAGITFFWGTDLLKRLAAGEVTNPQANAGVTSVGRILAASALSPVLVFFCRDPFDPANWSISAGVVFIAGVAWVAVNGLVRVPGKWSHGAALVVACAALPISATGSVTVASLSGWYHTVVEATPLPDVLPSPSGD